MQFNKFYRLYEDIEQDTLDEIRSHIGDRPKPFEHVFKGKERFAIPLRSELEYRIQHVAGDSYELDFPNWVGYKTKDALKKNPERMGKILTKMKQDFAKKFQETKDPSFQEKIDKAEQLLLLTNLRKQWEATKTSFVVVYSRNPTDIVRMSDHTGWRSCHSTDGDWFKCAAADATHRGAIAYLVKEDVFKQMAEKIPDWETNEGDVFFDAERESTHHLRDIRPVARVRLRQVKDSQGNELMVPSLKVYTGISNSYLSHFTDQVKEVCLKQDISSFDFDNVVEMHGGTYQDGGYDVAKTVEELWGQNIVIKKKSNEDSFSFAKGNVDEEEELLMDEVRDTIESWDTTTFFHGSTVDSDMVQLSISMNNADRCKLALTIYATDVTTSPSVLDANRQRGWRATVHNNYIDFGITLAEDYFDYFDLTTYVDVNIPLSHIIREIKDRIRQAIREYIYLFDGLNHYPNLLDEDGRINADKAYFIMLNAVKKVDGQTITDKNYPDDTKSLSVVYDLARPSYNVSYYKADNIRNVLGKTVKTKIDPYTYIRTTMPKKEFVQTRNKIDEYTSKLYEYIYDKVGDDLEFSIEGEVRCQMLQPDMEYPGYLSNRIVEQGTESDQYATELRNATVSKYPAYVDKNIDNLVRFRIVFENPKTFLPFADSKKINKIKELKNELDEKTGIFADKLDEEFITFNIDESFKNFFYTIKF